MHSELAAERRRDALHRYVVVSWADPADGQHDAPRARWIGIPRGPLRSLSGGPCLVFMTVDILKGHGGVLQQIWFIALHPLPRILQPCRGVAPDEAQDFVPLGD